MDRHEEATHIYAVLKPIFFTSKILGLAPYNVVRDTNRTKIGVSILAVVYNLTVSIAIASIIGYRQFKIVNLSENIFNSSESILVYVTFCSLVLTYLTLLLSSRRIARLFDNLNDVVEETSRSVWKKDLHTMLSIQTFAAIMLVSGIVTELGFSVIAKEFDGVLRIICFYIAEFSCFVSESQFVAISIVLKRTVQNWNSQICAHSENEGRVNFPCSAEYTRTEGSNLFTISNTRKSTVSERAGVSSMVTYFRQIRKQHGSACEVAESANSVYSAVLLLAVTRIFISLTHVLYYILLEFVAQKMGFMRDAGESIPYFICLLYYALQLMWLVHFTSFTSKEMNHTAVVVHRFLCKTNDLALREELQEFSLQLLHRKVKFTACGLFPLDYTLFYSIVGVITTYLVILFQFQLALPDSSKNMTTGIETYVVTPDSSENQYPHQ